MITENDYLMADNKLLINNLENKAKILTNNSIIEHKDYYYEFNYTKNIIKEDNKLNNKLPNYFKHHYIKNNVDYESNLNMNNKKLFNNKELCELNNNYNKYNDITPKINTKNSTYDIQNNNIKDNFINEYSLINKHNIANKSDNKNKASDNKIDNLITKEECIKNNLKDKYLTNKIDWEEYKPIILESKNEDKAYSKWIDFNTKLDEAITKLDKLNTKPKKKKKKIKKKK